MFKQVRTSLCPVADDVHVHELMKAVSAKLFSFLVNTFFFNGFFFNTLKCELSIFNLFIYLFLS